MARVTFSKLLSYKLMGNCFFVRESLCAVRLVGIWLVTWKAMNLPPGEKLLSLLYVGSRED